MNKNYELTFIIGEETRPKIEKAGDFEKSFFKDVYRKALGLVCDMLVDFEKRKEERNAIGEYYQESRSNIIAFVGERGSGKTSCLQSVYQCLAHNYKKEMFTSKHDGFLSLPTIDPSYFGSKSNILEIIIANMFSTFKEDARKSVRDHSEHDDARQLEKKRILVAKFQAVKNSLDRINEKDTKISNDSIEELSQLASGVNMKKQINELVEKYLDYFAKGTLIIAIDDMDLQTRHAFDMVEQIRKYLVIPNVIIFAGIKLLQLKDIIKQNYYKEYELLIEKDLLSDSIENIVERYIAKLLPTDQQLYLPELSDNLEKKVKIIKEGEKGEEDFTSIDIAVLHLIFRKTRYMFYNSTANKNLIIPSNLRDLWGLLSFLLSMREANKNDSNYYVIIAENRIKFREYFVKSWCYEHLNSEYYKFIQEIIEYDLSEVNKKIVDYLSNICVENKIRWDDILTYYYNKPYNISLADIDYFLDRLSRVKRKPIIDNFVFALRTVYSMLLYKTLENGRVQTKEQEELQKDVRFGRFSDYEKLLGGELIQIENAFERKKDVTEDSSNLHEKNSLQIRTLLHHHQINKELLKKLADYVFVSKDENSQFKDLSSEMLLNICQFFLLTTYTTSSTPYYRSRRFCYYSFKMKDVLDGSRDPIYSSYSILFTICKFYYEYQRYYNEASKSPNLTKNKNVKSLEDITFLTTWDKLMNRDSLFCRILLYDEGDDRHGIKEGQRGAIFENKDVEKVFIRNLDILDNLQDHLPYLGSMEFKGDDSDLDNIIKLYDKLSSYKFLIYPKCKNDKKSEINFRIYKTISDFLKTVKNDKAAKEIFLNIFNGCYNQ